MHLDLDSSLFALLLITFPVVGGFLFARDWEVSEFAVVRESGHKVHFRAIYYGVCLWFAPYLFFKFIHLFELLPVLLHAPSSWLEQFSARIWPSNFEAVAFSSFSLFLGAFGPSLLNRHGQKFAWYRRWQSEVVRNEQLKDQLEGFLLRSKLAHEWKPICFTLDTGKVVVGYHLAGPNGRGETTMVEILPILSGYRKTDHTISFTTDYGEVLEEVERRKLDPRIELVKLIDAKRIIAMNYFDGSIYSAFQKAEIESKKLAG